MIRLPDFVVDVIDPAGRYLRDGEPTPRRDLPRRFAHYTPITPRQQRTMATVKRKRQAALDALRENRREPTPRAQATIPAVAAELAIHARASVGTNDVRADARLLRFWHGDAVLEYTHPDGLHRTRIFRRALRDPQLLEAELAKHLAPMLDWP